MEESGRTGRMGFKSIERDVSSIRCDDTLIQGYVGGVRMINWCCNPNVKMTSMIFEGKSSKKENVDKVI